jgi:hypothetical protein
MVLHIQLACALTGWLDRVCIAGAFEVRDRTDSCDRVSCVSLSEWIARDYCHCVVYSSRTGVVDCDLVRSITLETAILFGASQSSYV